MSNLLRALREAVSGLQETTASSYFAYSAGRNRRVRRRKETTIDKFLHRATTDESLAEAATMWARTQESVRAAGMEGSAAFVRSMAELSEAATADDALSIHRRLCRVLEATEGKVGSAFEKVHRPFVKSFEKEFGISIPHWEAVAEAVFIETDLDGTVDLSSRLESVRKFAEGSGYVILKKGTTDPVSLTDRAEWAFIFVDDHRK